MRRSIQAAFVAAATVTYLVGIAALPAGALTVTSASPDALMQGTTKTVTLTGSGMAVGDTVSISPSNTGVAPQGTATVNGAGTQMTFSVVVSGTATLGDYDVKVTHPGGGLPPPLGPPDTVATCTACLQVISSSAVNPNTGSPTAALPFQLTVSALHIRPTASLSLVRTDLTLAAPADKTISATSPVSNGCVNGNCTSITGGITTTGRTPGVWDVVINNDNGTNITIAGAFTINNAVPTFAATGALNPDNLGKGAGIPTPTPIAITGTNLFRGMKVEFLNAGNPDPDFQQAGPVVWTDNQHVSVPVQIQSTDTTGTRTVRLTNNPDGTTNVSAPCTTTCTFTINAAPTVTSVSPTQLGQGATNQDVTVNGTGFATTGTVTVAFINGPNACNGVTVGPVAAGNTATVVHVPVSIAANATPNQHCDVVVHNPDQGGVATTTHPFTVTPAPNVTSANPALKPQGFVGNVVLAGTNFATGIDTPLSNVSFSGTGITVNSITRNSASQLTVGVTVAGNAAATARAVTVTNPDFGTSTTPGVFTVLGGPTMVSLNPNVIGQGATSKVIHVTGTGFKNSAAPTVAFHNLETGGTDGVTVGGVAFVDASHVDVTVSVRALNPPTTDHDVGNYSATLTNNDGGATTLSPALSVTAAPSTSGTASNVGQGAVDRSVVLTDTGNSFRPGMTIAVSGTGVTVKSVTVTNNGGTATYVIDVASNAATGARNLTLTNPDFGTSTFTAGLIIDAAPTVTSVNPPATSPQSNASPLTGYVINGTGFDTTTGGAVPVLIRAGEPDIIGTVTGTATATQLTVSFPLDNPYGSTPAVRAAPGSWAVGVRNADGGQGSLASALTVANAGAITVASITPDHLAQGGTNTFTVNGTNFAHGATVNFGPKINIDPDAVDVLSATQLTVSSVVADFDAATGPRTISVTNTDANGASCPGCLTISPAPTIDAVIPEFVNPTGEDTVIEIIGSGFQQGATVQISQTVFDIDTSAPTHVSIDGTVLVATINVEPSAARTLRDVFVTNPDQGVGSCPGCLAIVDQGYWMVAGDGGIFSFPSDRFRGSTGNLHLNKPIVGMAADPDGDGYWFVASDGGIFAFSAPFFGSTGNIHLNQPIVGMAATPSGEGYWLVASDGGIFAFGDAVFRGSMGGSHLNKPIVGIAATPSGDGYWMVASDGGIFSFGDALFQGSTGNIVLNKPIVAMVATLSGDGYSFVASDGGVFNFGDALPFGSASGGVTAPIVGMTRTLSGEGYWLAGADGHVYNFGDADAIGDLFPAHLSQPIVGIAAST